jgi:U6 snRNA phosphodiesterase
VTLLQEAIEGFHQIDAGHSVITSFLTSDLKARQPLHVSLSAPLVLRSDQRDRFREHLERAISTSTAQPFNVSPTHLDWVANQDKSRHFLVLKLTQPRNDDLNKLLTACNGCAKSLGLEQLYANSTETASRQSQDDLSRSNSSSFHISIAWALASPTVTMAETLESVILTRLRQEVVNFSTVKMKIGNVVIEVPLENG